MLAILMAALAPAVSRAVVAAAPGPLVGWADICTVGSARVAVDAAAVPTDFAPGRIALHMDHCPYCHFDGHAPALPVPAGHLPTVSILVARLPFLFLQAPRTLHAWRAAQPRAPPTLLS